MTTRHEHSDAAVRRQRGGSYAVGRARRARILHIAMEEFAENGYRGASLARIAERAEISQPGLLHHFHTKEELLVATLDLRDEMDGERFTAADGTPLTGIAALEALADLVERNQRIPGLVQLFTVLSAESVTADHPAHAWAHNRYRRIRRFIADAIRAGIASAEFRPDVDPQAHAFRLVAIMDGLQQQWLLDAEAVDMAAVFGVYLRETLEMIRARPES
ncbi:TetR/AcrR family transcriptional regulator [Prescottella agglutinans]|uniref:AcrR family transcriptional regulator n=1 Tax=Prescottella agglutinans TaxID=1644129 RepID=A0ABT6MH31_9NOCA|nr:TetR/AcrR family transcriptional regulator [Prescottella agglutinans]MDH6283169.1 AcrR family transcriptional regulator [Prescottella agglutinans]